MTSTPSIGTPMKPSPPFSPASLPTHRAPVSVIPQTVASSTPKASRKRSFQAWVITSRSGVGPGGGALFSTSSSRLSWAGNRIDTVDPVSAACCQNALGLKRSTTVRRQPAWIVIDCADSAPVAWASGTGRM